jgi:hypothetical protein
MKNVDIPIGIIGQWKNGYTWIRELKVQAKAAERSKPQA